METPTTTIESIEDDSSSLGLILSIIAFVVMAAIFIGQMLFGKNSYEVFVNLNKKKGILENKIITLQKENASLQKKYFEYINILPSKDKN